MAVFDKRSDREKEVLDNLLEQIDAEEDINSKKTMAQTYKELKDARGATERNKQGWLSAVLAGLGTVGTLALSYFMFKKPYDMQEKAVYVTDKIGQDNIRDAKSLKNKIK